MVLFGNRNFDDGLIELRDILENTGFHTVAAAAFVGEHSFSKTLAAGRPDADDMKEALAFAGKIAAVSYTHLDVYKRQLQLWPVYRDIREGWQACGEVTGQVLYEKDGTRYQSPYYFLGSQTAVSDTVFWGRQENTDVFAAFSMPRQGDAWSGYVAYPA